MKKGDKLAAIAVAGPYGAVKEQVSGRYAQEMAARGFLPSPLILLLQVKVQAHRVILLHRILIRKIFLQQ